MTLAGITSVPASAKGCGAEEGAIPDLHERGRLGKVEAREIGVAIVPKHQFLLETHPNPLKKKNQKMKNVLIVQLYYNIRLETRACILRW